MGFRVGIPTLKLSNKVGGNTSRKRTGTLRAVACEALEERYGRDPDIVKDMTAQNWYEGIRSGVELTERMTQEAEEYSQRRKAAGGRALRDTASIGFVTIIKPDMDAINSMTPEQREQFFADSREILDDILGRDNVRARVIHRDELGEHEHDFRMGFTEDGKLSVDSLVNPRIWRRVNLEYPQKMREKGWEVEDCEMYDAGKAEADPEYREARRARKRETGRGSSKFKRDRDMERAAALDARDARQAQVADVLYDQRLALDDARREFERERKEWQRTKEAQERDIEAREKLLKEKMDNLPVEAEKAAKKALEAREKLLKAREDKLLVEAKAAAEKAVEDVIAGRVAAGKSRREAAKAEAAKRMETAMEGIQATNEAVAQHRAARQSGKTLHYP